MIEALPQRDDVKFFALEPGHGGVVPIAAPLGRNRPRNIVSRIEAAFTPQKHPDEEQQGAQRAEESESPLLHEASRSVRLVSRARSTTGRITPALQYAR